MPKTAPRFVPTQLREVFALYLARELSDPQHVRWYARLTQTHSMCLLVNALRRARAAARTDAVTPEQFIEAVSELLIGEVTG